MTPTGGPCIGVGTVARNGRCVLLEVDSSAPGLDVSRTPPRLWVTLATGIGGGTACLQLFDRGGCSLGRVARGQETTHVTRMCIRDGDSLGGL